MFNPVIYIFLGMVASGKSALAKALADQLKISYFNTDRVRKELAGLSATTSCKESFGKGIYSKIFTEQTYATMLDRAKEQLKCGKSVVLDGSYLAVEERQRVKSFCQKESVQFVFILCQCENDTVLQRLQKRAQDPAAVSDGRVEIFEEQKQSFKIPQELGPSELLVINTEDTVENLLKQLQIELKKII